MTVYIVHALRFSMRERRNFEIGTDLSYEPAHFQPTDPVSVPVSADALRRLARRCDDATGHQQASLLIYAREAIRGHFVQLYSESWDELGTRVTSFVAFGAMESAAIALMPNSATFTGARLADGMIIAQVVLGEGCGAHSRTAKCLAMGWLSALLQALACLLETSAASLPTDIDGTAL